MTGIDPYRIARVLARFHDRPVRVSTLARAMADDLEPVGVDRALFIEQAGGGRLRPNRRRRDEQEG